MPSKVAVLKTSPETVVEDYGKLMRSVNYQNVIRKELDTILKVNISWHVWYPACSTEPWQYEGVVKTLQDDGFDLNRVYPAHNKTVVVDDKLGIKNNHYEYVDRKYNLKPIHLYEPEIRWIIYEPKGEMLALNKIYPKGIKIPEFLIGKNIIQLPTVKTHVFTTITGAMKNAFGGLLSERRHWTHSVIHETLIDLLTIQKEIHPGLFAVMDGTICGDGAGPRCMQPHIKNYILASEDQVAIDAISAKIQGFDPLTIDFIRMAHEKGLGCGDPKEIEIVGEDISEVNFHFKRDMDTFASRGQKAIYHGALKPLEKLLLRTPIVPWSYLASKLFHDYYWFPFIGRKRVKKIMETKWGELFKRYKV